MIKFEQLPEYGMAKKAFSEGTVSIPDRLGPVGVMVQRERVGSGPVEIAIAIPSRTCGHHVIEAGDCRLSP
jgi:hypothetical protein